MKLYELLEKVGINIKNHKANVWDGTQYTSVPINKTCVVSGQTHSANRDMLNNHMDDELPMFIMLGPIAIFALRIPTKDRYSLFSANSIGIASYPIERYNRWSKSKFNEILNKLTAPDAIQQQSCDEFETWSLLQKIQGDKNE